MPTKQRNYRREYDMYHGLPEQIKRRASRNKARKIMLEKYGKKKLKGMDVHHKNGNANDNRLKNLKVLPIHINRGVLNRKK
jgi:hypothetical protein